MAADSAGDPPVRLEAPDSSRIRSDATLTPQDHPEGLRCWWTPDTAGGGGYLAFKVEVVQRQAEHLTFRLVEAPDRLFTVDLLLQTTLAWPVLPSTAQKAAPGQFGVLLLSRKWMRLHGVADSLAGSREEWPPVPEL